MTALQVYLHYAGGSYDLRKALKVSKAVVSYWNKNGVPIKRIREVSRVTGISEVDLIKDTIKLKSK
jgi:hypothetical protein